MNILVSVVLSPFSNEIKSIDGFILTDPRRRERTIDIRTKAKPETKRVRLFLLIKKYLLKFFISFTPFMVRFKVI